MPYENEDERVADVDGESLLCWVCEGNLRPETTIDLHTGFSVELLPELLPLSQLWCRGLAVSRHDRLLPPDDSRIATQSTGIDH